MFEKYFIITFLFWLIALSGIFWGAIMFYLRTKHLVRLAQNHVLRRQQLMNKTTFYATYVIRKSALKLIFSFNKSAKTALIYLIGGRINKAVEYFKGQNEALSLLLSAHGESLPTICRKLLRQSKLLKQNDVLIFTTQMTHLLFWEKDFLRLLARLPKKRLPAKLKAYHAYLSAFAYLQEADMLSASENASQALKLFKKYGYLFEEAQTYLLMTEIYRVSCIHDVAQVMGESALKIFAQQKLSILQAKATAILGTLMLFENRLEEAEDKLNKALLLTSARTIEADIYNQLSLLKLAQKHKKSALKMAQKALTLHQFHQNERGEAFSRQLLGHYYFNAGNAKKTVSYAKIAGQLYLKQQNFSAYVESLYLQARALCQLEKFEPAEKLLRLILEEDKKQSLNFHIAHAYSLLGLIYLHLRDLPRAKTMLRQSLQQEQRHERCSGLAADYANLSIIETLSGNIKNADDNLKLAKEYAQKTEDADLLKLIENSGVS